MAHETQQERLQRYAAKRRLAARRVQQMKEAGQSSFPAPQQRQRSSSSAVPTRRHHYQQTKKKKETPKETQERRERQRQVRRLVLERAGLDPYSSGTSSSSDESSDAEAEDPNVVDHDDSNDESSSCLNSQMDQMNLDSESSSSCYEEEEEEEEDYYTEESEQDDQDYFSTHEEEEEEDDQELDHLTDEDSLSSVEESVGHGRRRQSKTTTPPKKTFSSPSTKTPNNTKGSSYWDVPRGPSGRVSETEQWRRVAEIANHTDKALQRLLFQESRFQFTLLPHQFEAVRRVAGVPSDFPCHAGSRVKSVETATMEQACHGLDDDELTTTSQGLCLADAMGLGKTVEAIAGAILSNLIAEAMNQPPLPTLILSPNDAVQTQWRDTLILNGVRLQNIKYFEKGRSYGFKASNYILLTRHDAQAELKDVWDHQERTKEGSPTKRKSKVSPLFPKVSDELLGLLAREYKSKNQSREDIVTQLVAEAEVEPAFRMVIVDEAHFLKNRLTYWTMATALACRHAYRSLPLTGTPYQNGVSDLATIITMIDPTHDAAESQWWKEREQDISSTNHVLSKLVLRRGKDVIADRLPEKVRETSNVSAIANEIQMYEDYESSLLRVLRQLQQAMKKAKSKAKEELFRIAMALMSCMRMTLIHPLVPGKGREISSLFSPSRRGLIKGMCQGQCVCCQKNLRPTIPIDGDGHAEFSTQTKKSDIKGQKEKDVDGMEEGEDYNDNEEELEYENAAEKVYKIPDGICHGTMDHYAHQPCLSQLKNLYESTGKVCCPRCLDLQTRAGYTETGDKSEDSDEYYCKDADVPGFPNGFIGSPKLNAVVQWAMDVLNDHKPDKMIILSFFKGSLDLMEGILEYELGETCARFDGDVDSKKKQDELDRFKSDPSCRVLLMTVQSGGVGLNITEANHVAFLDRWYNPFVHEQAEDRCHRIGQVKEVNVKYFDTNATIDEAMVEINNIKQNNAEVLLSGGVVESFVGRQGGKITYTELTGLVSNLIRTVQSHRHSFVAQSDVHKMLPIPSAADAIREEVNRHKQRKSWGGTGSKFY